MPEKKITKAIVCPMCGEMSKADVYTSINPSVTKGAEERLTVSFLRGNVRHADTPQGSHIRFSTMI